MAGAPHSQYIFAATTVVFRMPVGVSEVGTQKPHFVPGGGSLWTINVHSYLFEVIINK